MEDQVQRKHILTNLYQNGEPVIVEAQIFSNSVDCYGNPQKTFIGFRCVAQSGRRSLVKLDEIEVGKEIIFGHFEEGI